MFAICVESSHQKGMGHLFRAINLISFFRDHDGPSIVFMNRHQPSENILSREEIDFEIVPLEDLKSNWESKLIAKYGIQVWINDRLDTDIRHAQNVKAAHIKLVTFDDHGSGAALADLHFAPLVFEDAQKLQGRKVFHGTEYLALNPDINKYKRLRKTADRLLITLGGSDTYGVTLKVVDLIKKRTQSATIVIGPAFEHRDELKKLLPNSYQFKSGVPSLIQEFSLYDIAITGGGVTPFEANASGLPCMIIANEWFEIPAAKYLHQIGSSVFAGHWSELGEGLLDRELDIEKMSRAGMEQITTKGIENIYREIQVP
jgi:spore coat polysaccharide biosynthesis predicted glycosyltransferase SpsG